RLLSPRAGGGRGIQAMARGPWPLSAAISYGINRVDTAYPPSLPGIARRKTRVNALMTRQSIPSNEALFLMDARVKPAHDELKTASTVVFRVARSIRMAVTRLPAAAFRLFAVGKARPPNPGPRCLRR